MKDANFERIQEDLLTMFSQSIGWEFRVKGTPLKDICEGVDRKNKTVRGRNMGDFGVHLCELTGKTKDHREN